MTNADLALNIMSQINATEHEEMCKYSTGMELGTVHITTNSNPSTDWDCTEIKEMVMEAKNNIQPYILAEISSCS